MATALCIRCVSRTSPRRFLIGASRLYSDDASPLTTPLTPGPVKPAADATIIRSSTLAGTKLNNINYFKNKQDPVALEDSEYPEWLWAALDDSNKSTSNAAEDVGDLYSKSKKARSLAKKRAARMAALEALDPEKKVPIHEQTIDLPFTTIMDPLHGGPAAPSPLTRTVAAVGGVTARLGAGKTKLKIVPTTVTIGGEGNFQVTGVEAAMARQEIKKALRKKGRANIKEGNFLAQM
ncbi:mitochondrial ribosomal protein L37-domain-containing protein [Tricharina praecox]|uniref:mitochondrial ribosomal protein L37-domain-containing protein n=1 Tax=Tricharina praecox TaxID=43433 RepID=UPI0022209A4C|nr:mitochondrial ribosomal protein L37-domain-containing protein [Tricharina praecox]KAI5857816.1 mitochondrial ribosomal protein L37-domain-containing protein [Tricharina praecox]